MATKLRPHQLEEDTQDDYFVAAELTPQVITNDMLIDFHACVYYMWDCSPRAGGEYLSCILGEQKRITSKSQRFAYISICLANRRENEETHPTPCFQVRPDRLTSEEVSSFAQGSAPTAILLRTLLSIVCTTLAIFKNRNST